MSYEAEKDKALRWQRWREYIGCAYCGKLLAWRWKWSGKKHRLIEAPCQCERIGGHPQVVYSDVKMSDLIFDGDE